MKTCDCSGLWWSPASRGAARCCVCSPPPPSLVVRRVGVLVGPAAAGKIITVEEYANHASKISETAAVLGVCAAWPEGEWEVCEDCKVDGDGWPARSFEWAQADGYRGFLFKGK